MANSYAPSVPISVYRELAAELKSTQAKVDSLSAQNQQLVRQNQVLRQEFLQFALSAEQLKQTIESTPPVVGTSMALSQNAGSPRPALEHPGLVDHLNHDSRQRPAPERPSEPKEGIAGLAARATRLVKTQPSGQRLKPRPPSPEPLFTEQRLEAPRSQKSSVNSQDMSGLWLATTILLIVISAFGAGFLIMKPLLSGDR
ncbi:hypothetical protein C7271_02140 [filamentous cyanobacterium CCP5]|nr:hypothetical protein C7271_02140 [filamentous cyanobacterium CCP5]